MRTFSFKKIFVSVLLLVAVTTAFAQPEVDRTGGKEFHLFSDFAKDVFDVKMTVPKGFAVTEYNVKEYYVATMDGDESVKFFTSGYAGFTQKYGHTLVSDDGNCMMIYPMLCDVDMGQMNMRKRTSYLEVYHDLAYAYQKFTGKQFALDNNTEWQLRQMLMLDCGGALSKAFNADSVKLATIPMDKPYKGKYTQCLGVYLYKAAHTPVYLKVLLAPGAQKEAGKYVDLLAKNVRYGNSKKEVQFERDKEKWYLLEKQIAALENRVNGKVDTHKHDLSPEVWKNKEYATKDEKLVLK